VLDGSHLADQFIGNKVGVKERLRPSYGLPCKALAATELSAPGRGDRGCDRDLAAELVRLPGVAFADALHLEGMQRVDLGPALALLLMADP
jgi:hypothetical protein